MVHIGGRHSVSQRGCVNIEVQPPLQKTFAPHWTPAEASTLQLPLHLPLQ
jgi:hypothetical protein